MQCTLELTSPKVSIFVRFPLEEKCFSLFSSGLFNFCLLFAPTNYLEIA